MTESSSLGNPALSQVSFTVNGELKTVRVYPMERLLDTLRHQLALTGAKEGCGEGECGSCSVLLNGALVNSCLVPVLQAKVKCGGAQCGICTPGMILAAHHLLQRKPDPTIEEIREGLSGNLCRCTGYIQIFEAVAKAARHRAAT